MLAKQIERQETHRTSSCLRVGSARHRLLLYIHTCTSNEKIRKGCNANGHAPPTPKQRHNQQAGYKCKSAHQQKGIPHLIRHFMFVCLSFFLPFVSKPLEGEPTRTPRGRALTEERWKLLYSCLGRSRHCILRGYYTKVFNLNRAPNYFKTAHKFKMPRHTFSYLEAGSNMEANMGQQWAQICSERGPSGRKQTL